MEWSQGVSFQRGDPVAEAPEELMFSMSYGTTSSLAEDEQLAEALQQKFSDEPQLAQVPLYTHWPDGMHVSLCACAGHASCRVLLWLWLALHSVQMDV